MVAVYVLLCIIALLMVLLFVPVRYRAVGRVGKGTNVRVDISWLCRLISMVFTFRAGKAKLSVRIAGKRLARPSPKSQTKSKSKKNPKSQTKPKPKTKSRQKLKPASEPALESTSKLKQKSEPNGEPKSANESKSTSTDAPKSIAEKWETVKAVLTYPERKTIMNIVVLFIKKILRAIRPDRLDVEGVVGLGDPFQTGLFMGAYEAAAGMTRLRRSVRLQGNFNEPALQLQICIDGRLCFGRLLWPVVWLCTRRPVFHILMLYIRKDKRKDESDGKREC